jgi:hypothetical protein
VATTKQPVYKFTSAKGVKKALKRQFGNNKSPLYDAINDQFDKPGGIEVPLSVGIELRAQQNERRKKSKLPSMTIDIFKNNMKSNLKRLRGKIDFAISFSEDEQSLIVEPKGE